MILSILQQASTGASVFREVVVLCGIHACIVIPANAMVMPHNSSTQNRRLEGWFVKGNTGAHLSPGIIRPFGVLGGFLDDSHCL